MNIIRLSVSTRITFRTSGENQIYSGMTQSSVKIGKVAPSLPAMKRGAKDFKIAHLAMDGRSSSSIH